MACRDFILPEPASYVFFYAVFNLRNLLYLISRLGLMGLKLHYATGSDPCFHPVNLSAVQNGVEVLLWICDGLEVIGVHKSFDDGL